MKNFTIKSFTIFFPISINLTFCIAATIFSQEKSGNAPEDIGWPRQLTQGGSTLFSYQPQFDEWKDKRELNGNIAFALTPKGEKEVQELASFNCGTMVDDNRRDAKTQSLYVAFLFRVSKVQIN